jgi:hypothetical protein
MSAIKNGPITIFVLPQMLFLSLAVDTYITQNNTVIADAINVIPSTKTLHLIKR